MPKSNLKRARKTPGRPEGVSGLRDKILEAGREIFAQLGYAGTSLKMISQKADVTTALITYYFGSKQKLHEEIYMQTAGQIGAMRLARLSEVLRSGASVEKVVSAFFEPLLEVIATPQGRAFLPFQWRVDGEEQELSFSLRQKAYDESTHAYARALEALLPDASPQECYARLAALVGAANYAISGRHRLDTLLAGVSAADGSDLMLRELRDNAYKLFF